MRKRKITNADPSTSATNLFRSRTHTAFWLPRYVRNAVKRCRGLTIAEPVNLTEERITTTENSGLLTIAPNPLFVLAFTKRSPVFVCIVDCRGKRMLTGKNLRILACTKPVDGNRCISVSKDHLRGVGEADNVHDLAIGIQVFPNVRYAALRPRGRNKGRPVALLVKASYCALLMAV